MCGSGEKYYLCFRRRASLSERAITDIQITFKSTIPLGYQTLNFLFDGTELPYFSKRDESEHASSSSNQNNDNQSNNNNPNNEHNEANQQKQSSSINEHNEESKNNEEQNENNGQQNPSNSENKEEEISFDNIPLIIYSRTGESNIIDIQLKELGTKLREGYISVDRSLDDNVANLNKGTADTQIHPIYISYANDLISYRFSKNDLNRQLSLECIQF